MARQVKKTKVKILFWDLETTHNVVASFSLFKPIIPHDCILKERSIICGSWKWQGNDKVESISVTDDMKRFRKNRGDDYVVVKTLHEKLQEADIIVAHNGDKFDLKYFNTRCLFHGLTPIAKPITVDTYKVAKKNFNFNSNRLDYIAKFLGVGEKIKTHLGMWLAIIDSRVPVEEAVEEVKNMVVYNKRDVVILEKVYDKIKIFMDNHPNANLFIESEIPVCPVCGGKHLQKRGYRATRTGRYARYQCQSTGCGAWSSAGTRVQATPLR